MTQNKRVVRINKLAPNRFDGGGFAWDNSEIVFGDPVAKQAARAGKQAESRKESLRKYHARQGRDTRQDMVKRFGSV